MNCSCYRAVEFLESGMKVVEVVLARSVYEMVTVDEIQFGLSLVKEHLMLCLSSHGGMEHIISKEKVVGVLETWTQLLKEYYGECWGG